ncbi:hypothetical protein KCU67_g14329, partial [Aureobasidium melanogenum]
MAASIASSESGNSSDLGASSTHSERKEVNQNGSRKRRRLSPTGSEDSDSEPETTQQKIAPMATASRIQPSISRIKAKSTSTTTTTPSTIDSVSSTIAAAQKGNERSTFADLNVSPWLVSSLANMAIKNPTR